MPATLSTDEIRRAPKVVLHDHLDGGLRPQTILELADEIGYGALPEGATDVDALAAWFQAGADGGTLERFLEGFAHTVGVMATESALHRVASECAQDLAEDGVVYAEVRYAPELFVAHGIRMTAAIEAINAGFRDGERAAASAGRPIRVETILCAMRQNDNALKVAQLAVKLRDSGIVGFDIAGPEIGFSATRHADAFEYLRRNNMRYTAHAGEAVGATSIWEALQLCSVERLGHGVRITDGIGWGEDAGGADATLDRLAQYVRDRRIPLEICPTSNLQTGIAASIADHPFDRLRRLGFAVTVNTDDRLMCATTMTRELTLLVDAFGYGLGDLAQFADSALEAAFLPLPDRAALRRDVLAPGFAALGA